MIKMSPVVSDAHDHIIYNEVYIPNDVVSLFCWRIVRAVRLQFSQHKLVDKQFVQPIEFGEVVEDGFAVGCEDDCIADHVDDVLSIGDAAEFEVRLENEDIVIVLEQAIFLAFVIVEA